VTDSVWDSTHSIDAERDGVSSFHTHVAENVYWRDNLDLDTTDPGRHWETFTSDGAAATST